MNPSRAEYDAYMVSNMWGLKRGLALHAAKNRCQRCGARPKKGEPLEVHHKTYERFRREIPADLEVLCQVCHEKADIERRFEVLSDNYGARLDGWATKVYGEGWQVRIGEEVASRRFEIWLDEQGQQ